MEKTDVQAIAVAIKRLVGKRVNVRTGGRDLSVSLTRGYLDADEELDAVARGADEDEAPWIRFQLLPESRQPVDATWILLPVDEIESCSIKDGTVDVVADGSRVILEEEVLRSERSGAPKRP